MTFAQHGPFINHDKGLKTDISPKGFFNKCVSPDLPNQNKNTTEAFQGLKHLNYTAGAAIFPPRTL